MRSSFFFALFFLPGVALAAGVSGQLKSTTDYYQTRIGKPASDLTPYLNAEVGGKHRLQKSLRAQWKLSALANFTSKYPPENFYGDIPEAFVEYKGGDAKFRLGMNTVNWGVVDISSPSDVVNTVAMFHPLRTTRQGAPMVEAIVGGEELNVDLIYIPVQRPPTLPAKDSRWLPREFLLDLSTPELGAIQLPKVMEYEWDRPETFDRALNNNAGVKVSSHLGSLDLQVTHFEGAAPFPKIRPHPVLNFNVAESPMLLTPVYYRVRTSGFGFAYAAEKWIVRGESAYQHTISSDPLLQPWSWSNVLALETNVDVGSTTVTLLAQIYYTLNPQDADNMISSSYRVFDRTGVLGARWAYSEKMTITASALYETVAKGLFWMVGFEDKLNDHLRWGLSWRDFSAQKDGLLKTFDKNDHASMDLVYYF